MSLPILDALTVARSGEFLGRGIHRDAYAHGDVVVKVARDQHCRYANRNEAESWERLTERAAHLAHLFAPVLAADPDGDWLVMPRAEALDPDAWCEWRFTDEGRGLNVAVDDIHPGNSMRLPDGRVVVTDYGFGVDVFALCEWLQPLEEVLFA